METARPSLLNEIRDVWRSPDGHLYAVGAGKYVLHYDGTAWTTLTPTLTTIGWVCGAVAAPTSLS